MRGSELFSWMNKWDSVTIMQDDRNNRVHLFYLVISFVHVESEDIFGIDN